MAPATQHRSATVSFTLHRDYHSDCASRSAELCILNPAGCHIFLLVRTVLISGPRMSRGSHRSIRRAYMHAINDAPYAWNDVIHACNQRWNDVIHACNQRWNDVIHACNQRCALRFWVTTATPVRSTTNTCTASRGKLGYLRVHTRYFLTCLELCARLCLGGETTPGHTLGKIFRVDTTCYCFPPRLETAWHKGIALHTVA